jgi:tetratricopeptide (TPR) repeat protein
VLIGLVEPVDWPGLSVYWTDTVSMMRNVVRRARSFWVLVLILAGLCGSITAQESPFTPHARTEFELEAYRDIGAEPDLSARLDLTESFLIRYPNSELRHLVMRARWNVFISLGEPAGVLGIAETALEEEEGFFQLKRSLLEDEGPNSGLYEAQLRHDRIRVSYYQSLTEAHSRQGNLRDAVQYADVGLSVQADVWSRLAEASSSSDAPTESELTEHQGLTAFFLRNLIVAHDGLGNVSEVIEHGERLLEQEPQDLFTLMTLSRVIAESSVSNQGGRVGGGPTGEVYALRAVEELDLLIDGGSIPPVQVERLVSTVHSTLGLTYFLDRRYTDAVSEFRISLEGVPRDAVVYYRLGLAYAIGGQVDEALSALARAVYLNYPRAEARDSLIRIYEERHGGLDQMEAFIDSEGQALR